MKKKQEIREKQKAPVLIQCSTTNCPDTQVARVRRMQRTSVFGLPGSLIFLHELQAHTPSFANRTTSRRHERRSNVLQTILNDFWC